MCRKQIVYYLTLSGKAPFLEWIRCLDIKSQAIIDRILLRVAEGGRGNQSRV